METKRLIIRPFTRDDLPAFFTIYSNIKINRFLPWFPIKDMSEAEQKFEKHCDPDRNRRYAICLKEDNPPIGYVNLSLKPPYDLGYAILPQFHNKGYVTEASTAFIEKLKAEGHPYITATHDVLNPASGRVMQKVGMHYCYTYEEQWMPKDILVNFRMYQLNLNGNHPVYEHYKTLTNHWMIEPELFLNTDIEKTQAYYKEEKEQCDCAFCKAFRKSFPIQYPETTKLLSFYGIDPLMPLETSPLEENEYGPIQYVLKGSAINANYTIEGLTIQQAENHPSYRDSDNTFVIALHGVKLPWEN